MQTPRSPALAKRKSCPLHTELSNHSITALGCIKDHQVPAPLHGQGGGVWLLPGQSKQARLVPSSLVSPRSQNGPTKPCTVQLGQAGPTQIPLLFGQGWFRNEMGNQGRVESEAAFIPVTHYTPSVQARAGSGPEELCPPPPPSLPHFGADT